MSVSGAITVGGGGQGVNFAFTVTGTSTLGWAQAFSDGLKNGFNAVNIDTTPAAHVVEPGTSNLPNLYYVTKGDQSVTIPAAGGYMLDSVGGAVTINGSSFDKVLVAAVNPQATYIAKGGFNQVIFIDGNNTYDATAANAGTGDTVVAGTGFDTIKTGASRATVFTGTGNASIYLNDTVAATGNKPNQVVWAHDGHSTVWANGVNDGVGADQGGQTIVGNATNANSSLSVLLAHQADAGDTVGSTVTAGAGNTVIYDGAANSQIFGGAGNLAYISLGDSNASVVAGTGQVFVFGADGDSISAANVAGDTAPVVFVAGGGTETFNGANVTTSMQLFGYTVAGATGVNTNLIAGSGNDTLASGLGNETLTGGAGNNTFYVNDVGGSNITIADFGASSGNVVSFGGFTADQVQAALSGATSSGGNLLLTFSDGTQVTFVGITDANALNGKIV